MMDHYTMVKTMCHNIFQINKYNAEKGRLETKLYITVY